MEICRVAVVIKKNIFKVEKTFFLSCMLYVVLCACSGGKLDKTNLIQFMKDLKQSHPDMTDEEAAKIAASKIADSKPKSRMYYKIGASREMAGGKKVDPKANMSDRLKVLMFDIIFYSVNESRYYGFLLD